MYKVFIKDKVLYLTANADAVKSSQNNTLFLKYSSSDDFKLGIDLLYKDVHLTTLVVFHNDLNFLLQELFNTYKVIRAAGGVVENNEGNILMIYRMDKWDLPKGKIEEHESPKEASIREVQEETGISELKIEASLPPSFYFYETNKGNRILKHIFWFKMHCNSADKLVPQTEEGITIAKWMNKHELSEAIKNTFPSIKELFASI